MVKVKVRFGLILIDLVGQGALRRGTVKGNAKVIAKSTANAQQGLHVRNVKARLGKGRV